MSNPTTLPADWAPLREAAAAFANRMIDVAPSSLMTIQPAIFADGMHAIWMVLLADLSKPGPRDFWARWLAEKVGLEVGATAPDWEWQQYGEPPYEVWWSLTGSDKIRRFCSEPIFGADDIVVPGIADITDPAAALRAALLAVVPNAE